MRGKSFAIFIHDNLQCFTLNSPCHDDLVVVVTYNNISQASLTYRSFQLIPLQLRSSWSNGNTSLRLVTHLKDQTNSQNHGQNKSEDEPEEKMELDRDVNLLAGFASVLRVVRLGTLAVVAVRGHAQDTLSMLTASVRAGLTIDLGLEASRASGGGQGPLPVVGAALSPVAVLVRKEFRSLVGAGLNQNDGSGIGLVDLLEFWDEGL